MVLYKLPFGLLPIKDIYAREKDDILDWLRWFEKHPRKVLELPGKNALGSVEDIVQVEQGELEFDFGGSVAGRNFAYIDLTPDFMAKIRFESVPSFYFFREGLKQKKVGNLYEVKVSNGSFFSKTYVPLDVFQGLKNCDLGDAERQAEEHIERLNRARAKVFVSHPKPTKSGDFN